MKANLRDFAGLFVFPCLLALLPWGVSLRLAALIARRAWFHGPEAEAALAQARCYLEVADEARWLYEYRLVRLMDDVDLYLWILHGDRWLERRVSLNGTWPQRQSFVAVTFHWGGGIWALRSMRAAGVKISGLALSLERAAFAGAAVRYWYARLRNRETAKIIGGGLNFTGDAARQLIRALHMRLTVCGLFDVPAQASWKDVPAQFLGRTARFPRGLARIAARHGTPVVVFFAAFDPLDCRHKIWVDQAIEIEDETALVQHLSARLEYAIRMQSSAWHHWALVPQFFAIPAAAANAQQVEAA